MLDRDRFPRDQQGWTYRNLVWPVYGVLAGFTFAIVGLADTHAEPVAVLVVAGVAALLGVTQPAWRGHGGGPNRNRNRA